jgi:hypothetical protein
MIVFPEKSSLEEKILESSSHTALALVFVEFPSSLNGSHDRLCFLVITPALQSSLQQ